MTRLLRIAWRRASRQPGNPVLRAYWRKIQERNAANRAFCDALDQMMANSLRLALCRLACNYTLAMHAYALEERKLKAQMEALRRENQLTLDQLARNRCARN